VDRPLSVAVLRCRTSDRTPGGALGAEALGLALDPNARLIGTPGGAHVADYGDDLRDSHGCILEAGGQVDDMLIAERFPVLLSSDCTICMTTFQAVIRHRPLARVLWLDAHGDFNTPETTPSGFLGGMCLAAACGRWDAGWPETIDPAGVHFLGVRELDPGEREDVERAGIQTGVPAKGPVYVHFDCDGLDPEVMPVQFPVPGGLSAEEVRDALAALAAEGRLIGLEVTALEDPRHAEMVAALLPIHHAT
jgi:arginase family enzyme